MRGSLYLLHDFSFVFVASNMCNFSGGFRRKRAVWSREMSYFSRRDDMHKGAYCWVYIPAELRGNVVRGALLSKTPLSSLSRVWRGTRLEHRCYAAQCCWVYWAVEADYNSRSFLSQLFCGSQRTRTISDFSTKNATTNLKKVFFKKCFDISLR